MSQPSAPSPSPRRGHDPLGKFPAEVRAAYQRYQQTGEPEAVDIVALAVIRDFMPRRPGAETAVALADETRLMADLGYDSLAIAESIFFFEDLFQVRINNAEIVHVSTVGELRKFIREKVAQVSRPNRPA